ncbi:MAG: hypothetical protein DMF84_05430 [Acidobacteria bacterium]|nr:MAG: hypothetical protein DMF84_05430 [Acidobacteriota bacterium]
MRARCFTVGVFQDVPWAKRGLEALARHGFPAESLTVLAKDSPDVRLLISTHLRADPEVLTVERLGAVAARGPLVDTLQGSDGELATRGLSGTIGRAGFQRHDGQIFEQLTARGGVLVAIHNEPRAADALAALHAYGGGNAAIGAWTGRL